MLNLRQGSVGGTGGRGPCQLLPLCPLHLHRPSVARVAEPQDTWCLPLSEVVPPAFSLSS
jgi:hypothetical protein